MHLGLKARLGRHGSGWSAGDKSELQRIPEWTSLLSQGFAVASVNYTLSTSAKFPQQIHEVKASIRYLRANGFRYGLNGRIGLWGGSAGGQLAPWRARVAGFPRWKARWVDAAPPAVFRR